MFEGKLLDYPGYPSVCSGGRCENLVGAYLRKKLPVKTMATGEQVEVSADWLPA